MLVFRRKKEDEKFSELVLKWAKHSSN